MSSGYNSGLSEYPNKGSLNLKEFEESDEEIERKTDLLVEMIKNSPHIVFHTGAGISTSTGIPDFRGPKGVWTLEAKGVKVEEGIDWASARPSLTHMAIVALELLGKVAYLVTQNVDGLHVRSGFPLDRLAELHGKQNNTVCTFFTCEVKIVL